MEVFFKAIQWVEEAVLAFAVLAIAVLTITNVVARSVFSASLASTEELCQFLIIIVTFIGLSYGVSRARHIRMTAVYDLLGARARKVLMVVICASTALLLFYLAWEAFAYAMVVRRLGSVSPALQVPLYAVYLVAPLGLGMAGVRYVMALVQNLVKPEVYLSAAVKDRFAEPTGGEI